VFSPDKVVVTRAIMSRINSQGEIILFIIRTFKTTGMNCKAELKGYVNLSLAFAVRFSNNSIKLMCMLLVSLNQTLHFDIIWPIIIFYFIV
jgi:hypothetical protein